MGIAIAGALVLIFDLFLMPGLKILNPNEALVLTLFGKYHGTLKGDGYFWVNPFCEGINPGGRPPPSPSTATPLSTLGPRRSP